MGQYNMTTTGTLNPVVVMDLGGFSFSHPGTYLLNNYAPEVNITQSIDTGDLKGLLDAGHIIMSNEFGQPITPGQGTDNQTAKQVPVDPIAGVTGTNVQEVLEDLKDQIDLGGGGGGSDVHGAYPFTGASATIVHNKGKFPAVTVVNSSNEEIKNPHIIYNSPNQLQVLLGISITGTVYIN